MARTLLLATPPLALLLIAVLVVAATDTDYTAVGQLTSKNTIEASAIAAPPPPPSSSSSSSSSPSSSSSSPPPPPPPPPPPSPSSSSSSSSSSSLSYSSSSSSSSSSSYSSLSSPPPPSENTQVTPTTETPFKIKGFYKGMSREFVNEHNRVRARYNAGPLSWDKTLALYARRWANQIEGDCDKAQHSDKKMYGECFFLGTNGTAEDALCSWEKEEDIYDKETNTCTPGHNVRDCGHFVIMINKEWKWIGCGRARCTQGPREGQFFISCSYSGAKPNNTVEASTP